MTLAGLYERAGMAALRRLDPETAHGLALKALNAGLVALPGQITSPRLRTSVAGMDMANPVGIAAGFDKNCVALRPLARAGFGFVEVGAATPLPQSGNPRPRLFRLTEDGAVINRFGFNNDGAEVIARRLAARPKDAWNGIPIGLNLGANKTSPDRAGDFAKVLTACGPELDFATVNVSSPNTEKLRDLQGPEALRALLARVAEARAALPRRVALFLKIAPDLSMDEVETITGIAIETGIDALICTNTTLSREGLASQHRGEGGGLSGRPLFLPSTRVLARAAKVGEGRLPLIGVGGIASAEDAYTKIRAGASAVQLYTALAYRGLALGAEIIRGLDALLARDGFATVAEAVGTDIDRWL